MYNTARLDYKLVQTYLDCVQYSKAGLLTSSDIFKLDTIQQGWKIK